MLTAPGAGRSSPPLAVVPHPRHQTLDPVAMVFRVPKIMKTQAFAPTDMTACGQADILLKLPSCTGPHLGPGKTRAERSHRPPGAGRHRWQLVGAARRRAAVRALPGETCPLSLTIASGPWQDLPAKSGVIPGLPRNALRRRCCCPVYLRSPAPASSMRSAGSGG